jgi:hypothetical protein
MADSDCEDIDWIEETEEEDKKYDMFYSDHIESINVIQILFDDKLEECLTASHSSYSLNKPGVLTSQEMIQFLKCQTRIGFRAFSILRFSVELDVDQIAPFLKDELDLNWLEEISYTSDLVFKECSKALHKSATLFILYKKRGDISRKHRRQTRVVKLGADQPLTMKNRKTRKAVRFA